MTFLSFLPIVSLIICLMVLKMSAGRSGAVTFLLTFCICAAAFRPGTEGFGIILGKGFGLAIFVIFIIWGAMFLYNTVNETGALKVINENISIIIDDKYVQFMFLAWIFAPFLQGIAGFGVPVIVVAPILISMGFDPVKSVAGVLLGHSWSISFGSMGSSIYAMDMVTDVPIGDYVPYMAVFGTIAMIIIGFAVSAIYGGASCMIRGAVYIIPASAVMGAVLFTLAKLEMVSVIGLITGLSGLLTIFAVYKLKNRGKKAVSLYKDKLNLFQSVLPYILIVLLSVAFFILDPKWVIELDFPGYTTGLGQIVEAEEAYVDFNVLKYPFSIILMSSLISMALYRSKNCIDGAKLKKIMSLTVKKCVPTSITLIFLLCTAQMMMDSGMISAIADFLVAVTGTFYPAISPAIGTIGAFITGSNTNSNVLLGNLQETAALALGLEPAIMCGAQSIGASVGNAIGPTTVALGATSAQITGQETYIYKKTLLPALLTVAVLGIANYVLINLM